MKPIGILGGTFDPIHFAHLRFAQEAAVSLQLREVRFIPAGRPPHRAAPGVSPQQRLEMTRLATGNNPLFLVDDREVRKDAPSYTIDTLTELRAELGEQQPLVLLVGADAFLGLASWHRWRELFSLTHIAVALRPGYPHVMWADSMPDSLRGELHSRLTSNPRQLQDSPAGLINTLEITPLDISATKIRSCVSEQQTPRYLLPDSVLAYIQQNHLYQGKA